MTISLELFVVGLIASIFGSMVGLGGGFILVPLLRLVFNIEPAEAAGTSLALVVANGASGAIAYLAQKRVHVRIGLLIALGGIPGSIVGALLVKHFSAQLFDWVLALFLFAVAIDTIVNRSKNIANRATTDVRDAHVMPYGIALFVGLVVGLVSSLFGIGGGVIVIPTLLYFSALPAHAISATSQFAIALTSPIGLITHATQHDVRTTNIIALVLAGLIGGPIGAQLSRRLQARALLYFIVAALLIMAGSLVARHL